MPGLFDDQISILKRAARDPTLRRLVGLRSGKNADRTGVRTPGGSSHRRPGADRHAQRHRPADDPRVREVPRRLAAVASPGIAGRDDRLGRERRAWRLAIVNYEKFNPKDLDDGVINEMRLPGRDRARRIVAAQGGGDSKQKKVLNASCTGIEYKLSCTATPAPNNVIEFDLAGQLPREGADRAGHHLELLRARRQDPPSREVKPHATRAFFDFMASWSIYLKHPKRFWLAARRSRRARARVLHPQPAGERTPVSHRQRLHASERRASNLVVTREPNAIERLKLGQIARGFVYRKDKTKQGLPVCRTSAGRQARVYGRPDPSRSRRRSPGCSAGRPSTRGVRHPCGVAC